jgi:arylsulfatase A-like enzyme
MEKELNTNETINSQKPALPKKFGIFSVCYAAVAYAFMIVMWATGWNFFPLVAVVLAAVSALLILISVVKWNKMPVFLWVAFLTLIVGTVLFHLGHSAESFGKSLWWNLVLTIAPIGLAVVIKLVKIEGKKKKIAMAVCAGLMAATSMVYFLFMNLRLNPTVERLWEGHDDYLNSLDPSKKEANSPNVLFILMDDMAYADISAYSMMAEGEATINTPNIDSIADGGIFMEDFYASAPVCTPSRFSALTGRYASRGYIDNVIFPTVVDGPTFSPTHFLNPYQFLHNVDGILGDEITIAEALDEMGYDTSCVGKWNLGDYGEYLPTNQGFDYFYGSYYVNDMTPYDWVEEVDGIGTQIRSHGDNKDQSETTRLLTDKVNEQINESISNGNNFFMYYATPWPHHPIYSDNNGKGKGDVTDDNYIDCIEEFDKGLGEIIQNLKDKGVYDDTLIVFTSDNGPGREGVAGNLRGRKNTTFEGGMKVPMLVSYPNGGVGQGSAIADTTYPITDYDGNVLRYATTKKVESSAMLQDLFPTILNYVMGDDYELPTDRIIDGVSLKTLLSGNMPSDFRVHDVLYYMKRGKIQGLQMAVDTPNGTFDFKYYDNVHSENSAFIDQFYKNYLFNLDTDPAEGYNIAKKNPEIASMMKEQLLSARKEFSSNRRGKI